MNRNPTNVFEAVVAIFELIMMYGPTGIAIGILLFMFWKGKQDAKIATAREEGISKGLQAVAQGQHKILEDFADVVKGMAMRK